MQLLSSHVFSHQLPTFDTCSAPHRAAEWGLGVGGCTVYFAKKEAPCLLRRSRCRVQWLCSWCWLVVVGFDWFPAACLLPLIMYHGSGTTTRPLAELKTRTHHTLAPLPSPPYPCYTQLTLSQKRSTGDATLSPIRWGSTFRPLSISEIVLFLSHCKSSYLTEHRFCGENKHSDFDPVP